MYKYCFDMFDMRYGLTVEDVETKGYEIVEKSGRPHSFQNGKARKDWYQDFINRFPHISLRREKALGQRMSMILAAVLVRLNLLTKPMYIYNANETVFFKSAQESLHEGLARCGTKITLGNHSR